MKVYLAGLNTIATYASDGFFDEKKPYTLESFYTISKKAVQRIPLCSSFMLDSGAFTFMYSKNRPDITWHQYVQNYAEFINKYNIDLFFELDIDALVGYDKVKELRKELEILTHKKPIPVWHYSRGKEEFIRMCQEYDYVAIGGLVQGKSKEYSRDYWKYFPWFINTAHKYGAKIHALGFTSISGIKTYHFDSVDSTSWIAGNKAGFAYVYKDGNVEKIETSKGQRAYADKLYLHNYSEWCKFQKWADIHL